MTTEIFNDLLFESADAQMEFAQKTANIPIEEATKLRSVLGKPSQFVGRVMNFDQAVAHWQAWHTWEIAENERKVQAAREAAAEKVAVKDTPKIAAAREDWHRTIELARSDAIAWNNWRRNATAEIRRQYNEAEKRREEAVANAREIYRKLRDG